MKKIITLRLELEVPDNFLVSAFCGALQGYFDGIKVLDWNWKYKRIKKVKKE